jgi:hypothetical protein
VNLYLLERGAPPGRPRAFLVAARDEAQARRLAAAAAPGERGAWTDGRTSTCALIGVTIPGDRTQASAGVRLREMAAPRSRNDAIVAGIAGNWGLR